MFNTRRAGKGLFACLLCGLPVGAWADERVQLPASPSDSGSPVVQEQARPSSAPPLIAQRLRRPAPEESEEQSPPAQAPAQPAQQPAGPPPASPYSPAGFAGRSFLLPAGPPPVPDFVPVPDRWRLGFPGWTRFEREVEAPYVTGHWWDPYNLNVLKGDYPILGQHTFLNLTGISDTLFEARRIPTACGESSKNPGCADFFGNGSQLFFEQNFILSVELFHGDTAFKPRDWEFRVTPVFNMTHLNVKETGVVDVDVRQGTTRADHFISLQELFLEYHLLDLSPNYDFISTRSGIQGFVSDFRGFVFSDNQLGFRLFGNLESNRDQFNVVYFRPLEKDTNSGLNRLFEQRGQDVGIVNFFRQDFLWPGYTLQLSMHYLHDTGPFQVNTNGFVVRPAVVGQALPHKIDATYLGWAGDGHIGPVNLTHQFYWVFGADTMNPIANRREDITAYLTALELSMDFDWLRPKLSFLWASGDGNPRDKYARGFDSIFDNPSFAGGPFSYWVRQGLPLLSTDLELVGRNSLLPSLRSSKIEGQPNYVNPGLFLFGAGADVDLTPKLRAILNVNFLRFHQTQPLGLLLFQPNISHNIGVDFGIGVQYRPFLNQNMVISAGGAAFAMGSGLKDVYSQQTLAFTDSGLQTVKNSLPQGNMLYSTFVSITLAY
jgi:hypothetical protein